MKHVCLILLFSMVISVSAQEGDTVVYVKYDKNYRFQDGVYMTFQEFKENSPSVRDFKVSKSSQFSGETVLETVCLGGTGYCEIKNCWGYVQNNAVYISQGFSGYYYRLQIIGALIHYFAMNTYSIPTYDYAYGDPFYRNQRSVENQEYFIEFLSGKKYEFSYKIFSGFLQEKDAELYEELQKSKKKRKMIYHFMLKYNELHPVYFPVK
jgi:hypothetical protein